MKKVYKIMFLVSVLVLCVIFATSCNVKLSKPGDFKLNSDTLELSWDKVPGAQSYVVEISDIERPAYTSSNSYPLEQLPAGTYTIKVKAIGDGIETSDSDYGTFPFKRAVETGLKYQLINNRSEYELIGGGTASGDVVMETMYRGKPVTSIADQALYNNTTITSFTVGKNVKSIGEKAFSKCTVLTSVVIPDNVTKIGQYAFQSSKALTSVTLSKAFTSIEPYTFSWCSALTSVTMGDKITSIGDYAFSNCKALASIVLSDALTEIGAYAFSDCIALTSLDLSGVKTIKEYGFCNTTSLAQLNLGSNMVSIGNRAFRNCSSLTTIIIPDSTTSIGHEAFSDCTKLATVKFGKGITDIGKSAFLATKLHNDAKNIVFVDGWILASKDTTIDTLNLPTGTIGIAGYAFAKCNNLTEISIKGVKYVGESAFNNCKQLMTVVADDSLLKIGNYAFANCELVTDIRLGNNIESIGKYAFAGDTALETITLPKSITSIGTYAFDSTKAFANATQGEDADNVVYIGDWVVGFNYAGNITYTKDLVIKRGTRGIADYSFYNKPLQCNVYLPDSLEYIGRSVFYGTAINSVMLSSSLKRIGDYAFYSCSRAVFGQDGATVIPSTVEYIGRSAFYKCEYIRSLTIPASVKYVGDYAFYGCINLGNNGTDEDNGGDTAAAEEKPLNKLVISEGVEHIGSRTFQGCESLCEVIIPNSVTYLGTHAFYNCLKLENAVIGSGIKKIPDYTFSKCSALSTVTLSESITSIEKYAFRGCESLKAINLSNVTKIGDYAFNRCTSLSDVKLSDSVTTIGKYAFRGCISIDFLVISSSVEYIGKHAFYGMNNGTIYCEASKKPDTWEGLFNSSYRPVFYGCEISEDGYVVSVTITKGNPKNPNAKNGISAPVHEGYEFVGWAASPDATVAEYTCENIREAPENTKLYFIWITIN